MAIAAPVHTKFTNTPEIQGIAYFADRQVTDIAALARRRSTSTALGVASVSTVDQAAQGTVATVQTRSMSNSVGQQGAQSDGHAFGVPAA